MVSNFDFFQLKSIVFRCLYKRRFLALETAVRHKKKKIGHRRILKDKTPTDETEVDFEIVEADDGNASEDEEVYELLMMTADARSKWKSKVEYTMLNLSYLVGLDHILSYITVFSIYGPVMLIPFFLCLVVFGIPILYLEMALGQYSSLDSYLLFERLAPAMAANCLYFKRRFRNRLCVDGPCDYRNGRQRSDGHARLESVFSSTNEVLLRSRIYFDGCHNEYNTEDCMDPFVLEYCKNNSRLYYSGVCLDRNMIDATTIQRTEFLYNESRLNRRKSPIYQYMMTNLLGIIDYEVRLQPPVHMFFFTVLVFAILVYFGVKSVRAMVKLSYFTALLPLGIVILFAIVAYTSLEEHSTGFKYFFAFKGHHLADPQLWVRSVIHMLVALKLGQGGVITLASYNKFHNDILLDLVIIVAAAVFIPLLFSFTIVSVFGSFARQFVESGEDSYENVKKLFDEFTDPDIFVLTGNGLKLIPVFAAAFLTLASICFFLLALGNMLTRLKLALNALSQKIEILRQPQNLSHVAAIIALISMFLAFTVFSRHGAVIYLATYMYTMPAAAMVVILCETITVVWCYGAKQFFANVHVMLFGESETRLMNEEQQGTKGKILKVVNLYLIAMLRGPVIIVLSAALAFLTYGIYKFCSERAQKYEVFKVGFPVGILTLLAVVTIIPVVLLYKVISNDFI
ncbi:hypothetical protein L596_027673 [Steinernema carpocapsae]|uniref:Uncharacterized protein n=1 Tax=Steinernema carpocapsae TaxID=34508 RepID=A0A4U5LW66_STECR|nr:hypothetical protein L596_027673 [Steinernema carpocapsae]